MYLPASANMCSCTNSRLPALGLMHFAQGLFELGFSIAAACCALQKSQHAQGHQQVQGYLPGHDAVTKCD